MKPAPTILIALCIALLAPWSALADEDEQAISRGELLYRVHCRSCHGGEAAGGGPMAEVLKVQPSDLTVLAENNDGEFDPEEVYRKIDGRDRVPGHGSSDMPIWGLSFKNAGNERDQEREVRGRLEDLVSYLESIQVGGSPRDPSER